MVQQIKCDCFNNNKQYHEEDEEEEEEDEEEEEEEEERAWRKKTQQYESESIYSSKSAERKQWIEMKIWRRFRACI
jgi:hypothetical protein